MSVTEISKPVPDLMKAFTGFRFEKNYNGEAIIKEKNMKKNIITKTIAASGLGLIVLLGTGEVANAQNRNNKQKQQQKVVKQQQKVIKQQEKIIKQQQKISAQQMKAEQERLRLERERAEQERIRRQNQHNRYRVYRNGSYYDTDSRGAELLRQAVNRGYQEGFRAGQADRNSRRAGNYRNSSVYNSGNYGYQSYVDLNQYRYYFQQGFERGYQDGYNSRFQYGSNSNGGLNILGTILQSILNIQAY
jgi:hypothetical protein